MVVQFLGSVGNKLSSGMKNFGKSYVDNLLIFPSFENGDTICDFQKYSVPVKMALGEKALSTSLFTFKKDADLNKDNSLSAVELTIWLRNNSSLGNELFGALGVKNLDDATLLNNWDSLKEKLPFDINEDSLAVLNKTLNYMDIENTSLDDVLSFAGALMLLDETTDGDLTKRLFGILDLAKQEKINAWEALNHVNGLFASFSPYACSSEVSSAVETVIVECKKILKFNVSNFCGNFLGDIAGWAFEVHTRKQSGLEVGVVDNVLYEAGKTIVKGAVRSGQYHQSAHKSHQKRTEGKSAVYKAADYYSSCSIKLR